MNTLFVGQNLLRFQRVPSTNDYTKELIRQSVMPEGTVVLANEQHSGRGQRGNGWHSDPGKNLTFSVVLTPRFIAPDEQFFLNKVVCLALVDLIGPYVGNTETIKWPNDIFIGAKKVAGVLIENSISNKKSWQAVVGIGLNVNQLEFASNAPNAISLSGATGQFFDLDVLLRQFCELLEARYLRLQANKNAFDDEYLTRLLGFQQLRSWKDATGLFEGKIIGVRPNGLLQIETPEGEREFEFKAVEFIQAPFQDS